jgi:hypothetical protein
MAVATGLTEPDSVECVGFLGVHCSEAAGVLDSNHLQESRERATTATKHLEGHWGAVMTAGQNCPSVPKRRLWTMQLANQSAKQGSLADGCDTSA